MNLNLTYETVIGFIIMIIVIIALFKMVFSGGLKVMNIIVLLASLSVIYALLTNPNMMLPMGKNILKVINNFLANVTT